MQKTYIVMLYVLLGLISFLFLLTKSQPLLLKRKFILGMLLMMLTAPSASLLSCRSGQTKSFLQKDIWETSGWVDGDTYRMKSTGVPKPGLTHPAQKKGTAKESAILNAQYYIIEKFRPAINESCASMSNYESSSIAVSKEITGIIKGGSVIADRYNEDYSCEIIYEVKSPDLKRKVESSWR